MIAKPYRREVFDLLAAGERKALRTRGVLDAAARFCASTAVKTKSLKHQFSDALRAFAISEGGTVKFHTPDEFFERIRGIPEDSDFEAFKTDEFGNLVPLVAFVDHVPNERSAFSRPGGPHVSCGVEGDFRLKSEGCRVDPRRVWDRDSGTAPRA